MACAHPCNFFAPRIGFVESLSAILGGLGGLSAIYRICSFHFPKKARHAANRKGESGKAGFSTESRTFSALARTKQQFYFLKSLRQAGDQGVGAAPPRCLRCSSLGAAEAAASEDRFRTHGYMLCATDAAAREINCRYIYAMQSRPAGSSATPVPLTPLGTHPEQLHALGC
jgi:hypothetical protein